MYARVDNPFLDDLDDAQLVLEFRNGNDVALHVLLRRHSDALYRFCLRLAPTREDAEDICQESLARAIDKVDSLASGGAFRTWLFRIARNLLTDSFRSRRRLCRLPDEDEPPPVPLREDGPYSVVEIDEEHRTVSQAFLRLTESHQRVLLLREVEGLSYKEIAQRLNVSQSAVETLLFRARRRLRQEYGKSERVSAALGLLGGIRGLALRLTAPIAGGGPVAAKVAVTAVVLGGAVATVHTVTQPHAARGAMAAATSRFEPHHVQRVVAPTQTQPRTALRITLRSGSLPSTTGRFSGDSRSYRSPHRRPRFAVAQRTPISRHSRVGASAVPTGEGHMGGVARRMKRAIKPRREPVGSTGNAGVHETAGASSGGQQTHAAAPSPGTAPRSGMPSARTSPRTPAGTSAPNEGAGHTVQNSLLQGKKDKSGDPVATSNTGRHHNLYSRNGQADASAPTQPAARRGHASRESHPTGPRGSMADSHGTGERHQSGNGQSAGNGVAESGWAQSSGRGGHPQGQGARNGRHTSPPPGTVSATPGVSGESTSDGNAGGHGASSGQGSTSGKGASSGQGSTSGGSNQGTDSGQGTAAGGGSQGNQSGAVPVQSTVVAVVTAVPADATAPPAHGQAHGNDVPPVPQPTGIPPGLSSSPVVPATTAVDPAHGRGRKP